MLSAWPNVPFQVHGLSISSLNLVAGDRHGGHPKSEAVPEAVHRGKQLLCELAALQNVVGFTTTVGNAELFQDVVALCDQLDHVAFPGACAEQLGDLIGLAAMWGVSLPGVTGELNNIEALGQVRCVNLDYLEAAPGRRKLETFANAATISVGRARAASPPEFAAWRPLLGVLANVRTVLLADAGAITDLTPFSGADVVALIRCTGLSDLTPLANVHTVDLSGCRGIDVTVLSGCNTVRLIKAVDVTGLAALAGVRRLALGGCTEKDWFLRSAVLAELEDTENVYGEVLSVMLELLEGLEHTNFPKDHFDLMATSCRSLLAAHSTFLTSIRQLLHRQTTEIPELATLLEEHINPVTCADLRVSCLVYSSSIGDAIRDHAVQVAPTYARLVCTIGELFQSLSVSRKANLQRRTRKIIGLGWKVGRDPTLRDLLGFPTTRFLRYPLLVSALLRLTPEAHPDREPLLRARCVLRAALGATNQIKRSKDFVAELSRSVGGYRGPPIDQLGPIVVEADLDVRVESTGRKENGAKRLRVVVFRDAILLCSVAQEAGRRSPITGRIAGQNPRQATPSITLKFKGIVQFAHHGAATGLVAVTETCDGSPLSFRVRNSAPPKGCGQCSAEVSYVLVADSLVAKEHVMGEIAAAMDRAERLGQSLQTAPRQLQPRRRTDVNPERFSEAIERRDQAKIQGWWRIWCPVEPAAVPNERPEGGYQ